MKIEPTKYTPEVSIEEDGLNIEIRGVSMPENAFEFYLPIINKIEDLVPKASKIKVIMSISYLNSMSNKQLLKLLKLIESGNAQKDVTWEFNSSDRLIQMKGMELKILCPTLDIKLSGV